MVQKATENIDKAPLWHWSERLGYPACKAENAAVLTAIKQNVTCPLCADLILSAAPAKVDNEKVEAPERKSGWIDNLVGAFDDSPLNEEVTANEKLARERMDAGLCVLCGIPDIRARAERAARRAVELDTIDLENPPLSDEEAIRVIADIIVEEMER